MQDPGQTAPRPVRISLQAQLLALVLVCVAVPVLSMGGYLLKQTQETLRDKVHEGLANQLFGKSTEVNEWMTQRLREAASWASSFVVFESVEALRHPSAAPERVKRELTDYLQSVLGHYSVYESLFVVDLSGEVLAATSAEKLDEWARSKIVEEGVSEGILSPLQRSERLGHATQLVVQPIQGRKVQRLGYFVGRIDLRQLEIRLSRPGDAETAFLGLKTGDDVAPRTLPLAEMPSFWLLSPNGQVLAEAGKVLARPGEEAFPAPLEEDLASAHPLHEATLPRLGRTIYGVRRLEGPFSGYLVGTLSADSAYGTLSESALRLMLFGGSALLLVCIVTFIAARRILRPIMLLADGAKRVSAGEFVDLPITGAGEIAHLTVAFNEMARTVRDGRQKLEEARDEQARSNEGLKAANSALEQLAITDGLTGLYNRRHFQDSLDKELARCEREDRGVSLLLLDLDHFKQYNDRWGHTEGDAALRRAASVVMKGIRSTDMAFRYGGEELAVLLPSCNKEQAVEVAEKIRLAVGAAGPAPGRIGGRTTISIGVATFPDDGRVARALVDVADAALYRAKAQGRDRVVEAGRRVAGTAETAG